MSAAMSVVWSPVPAGLRGDGAPVLSVLVSPRLRSADGTPARLSAFAPFVDWPATLRSLTPAVSLQGGAELPVTLADPNAPLSELWAAVFPPGETVVRSHEPEDFSQHELISYRSVRGRDVLRGLYADSATRNGAGPPPDAESFGALLEDHPELLRVSSEVARFHAPLAPAGEPLPPADRLADLLDFHAIVSALGDHVILLRRLGLLFDVLLPTTAPRSAVPTTVAFHPHFDPADVSPRVEAALDDSIFVALPAEAGGFLALRDGEHDLVELDLDGALLKFDTLQSTLEGDHAPRGQDAPRAITLPSLRSGGLAITLDGRAQSLGQRLAEHAAVEAQLIQGTPPLLTSDDLVRGYAIDVHDGHQWRSLCRRRGVYRFTRAPHQNFTVTDVEGWVQLAVTAHTHPDGAPALKLHESLARWDGWSLAAPRPGKALSHEDDPASPPVAPANAPLTSAGIAVDWQVEPLTLPALRFGRGYRMRARAVDLAGNVVELESDDDRHALPAEGTRVYRRFEPVPAPTPVLRSPLHPDANAGESSDRMVLRTDNRSPLQDGAPGVPGGDRQLAPPRASVQLAELHGALDDATGHPRADLHAMLSARDAAQLGSDPAGSVVVEAAERLVVPYLPDPLARGVALRDLPGAPEGTVARPDESGQLTYEPVAGAVVRRGSATLLPFGFDAAWPSAVGLRIAVADGNGPPRWDADRRLLTIELPKGTLVRVPMSCYVEREDLELMAVWDWMRAFVEEADVSDADAMLRLADDLTEAVQLSLEGGHWMITPPRDLVLVSAVRQPLSGPVFGALAAKREAASTHVTLSGELFPHGPSTSRIELLAEWREPADRDDGALPELAVPFSAAVADLVLHDPGAGDLTSVTFNGRAVGTWSPDQGRVELSDDRGVIHELHDTRHRRIRYHGRAATRFREYFPPGDDGDFTRSGAALEVDVPASARPPAPNVLYAVPTFAWERQEETNLHVSRRIGHGLRVYLARPWFASGEGERLGVVTWDGDIAEALSPDVSRYVTQVGRDPAITAPDQSVSGWSLARETELVRDLTIPGLQAPRRASVHGHEVEFDAAHDRWSCDIEFTGPNAYRPFVRLALARLQSHALPGAEVSPVVALDWAQLAPDRAALVTHDPEIPGRMTVTVVGNAYTATAATTTGSSVQLTLQERNASLDEELGWVNLQGFDLGEPETSNGPELLWRSTFDLPTDPARGPFRLVVEELEEWPSDAGPATRTTYFDVLPLAAREPKPPTDPRGMEFVHWAHATQHGARATGQMHGREITLNGPLGTAFYLHDDYPNFSSTLFTPPMAHTGMIEIVGDIGHAFTITFGRPVKDPVMHLGSFASRLSFAPGTPVTRLSGDEHFQVSGATVTGQPRPPDHIGDTLGPSDSNGSVRLTGVFTSIDFTLVPNYPPDFPPGLQDGVFIQIGGVAA